MSLVNVVFAAKDKVGLTSDSFVPLSNKRWNIRAIKGRRPAGQQ